MAALRLPFLSPALYGPARVATRSSSRHALSSTARSRAGDDATSTAARGVACATRSPRNGTDSSRVRGCRLRPHECVTDGSRCRTGKSRGFATTSVARATSERLQRYGKANEPPPHLVGRPESQLASDRGERRSEGQKAQDGQQPVEGRPENQDRTAEPMEGIRSTGGKIGASSDSALDREPPAQKIDAEDSRPTSKRITEPRTMLEIPLPAPATPTTEASRRDNVPPVPDSQSVAAAEVVEEGGLQGDGVSKTTPPRLTPPRFTHHFDSWGLVKDLEQGGYSQDQAITVMKAVRVILADNMERAGEGLVGRGDMENEGYLFRAACSELRTEIQNARKVASEKMRTERTHLQHEFDILTQKMTQDSHSLQDALKGLFDDRKMAVRMEIKEMEGKIQQLNHQIAVHLTSAARSEIEALRWVLTRRAAITLGISVFIILATLRYSSYKTQINKEAAARAKPPSDESSGQAGIQPSGGAG